MFSLLNLKRNFDGINSKKFKRKDLREPKNLKTIFRASKNYLAANNVGAVMVVIPFRVVKPSTDI